MEASDEIPKETAVELTATLGTYEGQMGQVEEMLRATPNDEDIKQIRTDVLTAIELTKQKLAARKLYEARESERQFVKDAIVEAQFEDHQWMTCKVTDVTEASSATGIPKTWNVLAIGYSHRFAVTVERIRAWRAPSAVEKGLFVDAVNPATGLFYPSAIDSVTENGTVWVKFKGSQKLEEVPLTHIKVKSGGGRAKRPRPDEEQTPQDLEREKKRKKKEQWRARVNAEKEQEEAGRKSWKDFQAKHNKKSKGKVGMGQSIFSSPANADGRVGVTGSSLRQGDTAPRPAQRF